MYCQLLMEAGDRISEGGREKEKLPFFSFAFWLLLSQLQLHLHLHLHLLEDVNESDV